MTVKLGTFLCKYLGNVENEQHIAALSSGVNRLAVANLLETLEIDSPLLPDKQNYHLGDNVPYELKQNIANIRFNSHAEFINHLISYLYAENTNNLITLGYKLGNETGVSLDLTCPGKNLTVRYLKLPAMELICKKIGMIVFTDLVLNFSGYLTDSNGKRIKIFGPLDVNELTHKKPLSNNQMRIKADKMLYVQKCFMHNLNPVSPKLEENLKVMFPSQFANKRRKNFPKNMRKLVSLTEKLMNRHDKLQYSYSFILDELCPYNSPKIYTDKSRVIKLVLAIFEKIFPVEFYGSAHNKSQLFKVISLFIYSKKNDVFDFNVLSKGFRLLDLQWFTKVQNSQQKLNKQTYLKLQVLQKEFLAWLIKTFVTKLVAAYFHVTELSQTATLLYYRHDTWRSVLKREKDRYFTKYLEPRPEANNDLLSFRLNEHFIGKLRFVPKKSKGEFRPIVVPFRGKKWEQFYHWSMIKQTFKPVLSVLSQVRTEQGGASMGLMIPKILNDYKIDLIKTYSSVPPLYCLKFDAKTCYDSLPMEKVFDTIKDLLNNTKQDFFLARDFRYSTGDDHKPSNAASNVKTLFKGLDIFNGEKQLLQSARKSMVAIDSTNNQVISRKEVLDVIYGQLFKTAIYSAQKTYVRREGVFQGFHMSPMFCNILYDKLTLHLIEKSGNHPSTKIIRIADDFLFLTADPSSAILMKRVISRYISQYNIHVNNLKSWLNFSPSDPLKISATEVSFCKLVVNLKDLSVTKQSDTYDSSAIFAGCGDYSKVYIKCVTLFKRRLSLGGFVVKYSSVSIVLGNLIMLLEATLNSYINSSRAISYREVEDPIEFYKLFFLPVVRATGERFAKVDSISNKTLSSVVTHSFVNSLSCSLSEFGRNISIIMRSNGEYLI